MQDRQLTAEQRRNRDELYRLVGELLAKDPRLTLTEAVKEADRILLQEKQQG